MGIADDESSLPVGVTASAAPLADGDPPRVGPFRLVGRLGAGGMGRVYLGVSRAGRPVAVKLIRSDLAEQPAFRRRFAAEVAAARRVQGAYTPAVVDADAQAERPWLATAYIAGPSLDDTVRRAGPLPPPVVRALAAGIAEALGAIHAAGVIHRDLKPGNVLLDTDGPKVIDFGIAAAVDATRLTATGVHLGTVGFMAPEQAGGNPLTAAADVFSLGCLLAYVATGVAPFGDGPPSEVLYRVLHGEPDPTALECGDARLTELIAACLRKEPAERPTVEQIVEACGDHRPRRDWLPEPLASRIHGRTPTRTGPRTLGRRRAAVPAGLGVAAVAVAVALTANRCGGSDDGSSYTAGYRHRTLSLPDYDHYIDLPGGKVVKDDTRWSLSTNSGGDGKGAFGLQGTTDAYVSGKRAVTPERCADRIAAHRPLREAVHFSQAPAGQWFCVRDRSTGDVALIDVLDTDSGDYTITVTVDYYRHAAGR
ncbi:serine/threonine-protein kinase [Streptomyces sp. NPDC005355]|uniref:serine/threonine-protein kinase n=1 Tax=Streptomyces sp. NPDC005355 TaxID=3157038 RepID=UPI0033ADA9AB